MRLFTPTLAEQAPTKLQSSSYQYLERCLSVLLEVLDSFGSKQVQNGLFGYLYNWQSITLMRLVTPTLAGQAPNKLQSSFFQYLERCLSVVLEVLDSFGSKQVQNGLFWCLFYKNWKNITLMRLSTPTLAGQAPNKLQSPSYQYLDRCLSVLLEVLDSIGSKQVQNDLFWCL